MLENIPQGDIGQWHLEGKYEKGLRKKRRM
jgi:hypothetical protein